MPNSRPHGMPAYQKIQATIIKRIDSGLLKPGDAVDSERELAKIHQVSLMTARHALTALEREGLVHRRRGAGTFVAPPKTHFNKLTSFTEQMASRSLTACSRVLSFSVVDNEQEVAARLALSAHTPLLRVERLRIAADEPFAVETCYLPADQFAGLTRNTVARGSLFSHFGEQLWDPNRLCRRGNGCNRRCPRDRKSSESSARCAVAQDPPSHIFDKRKSHALCARPVSIGSAHLVSPKISLAAVIARRPLAISLPRRSWWGNFRYSRPSSKWFFLRPRKLS